MLTILAVVECVILGVVCFVMCGGSARGCVLVFGRPLDLWRIGGVGGVRRSKLRLAGRVVAVMRRLQQPRVQQGSGSAPPSDANCGFT